MLFWVSYNDFLRTSLANSSFSGKLKLSLIFSLDWQSYSLEALLMNDSMLLIMPECSHLKKTERSASTLKIFEVFVFIYITITTRDFWKVNLSFYTTMFFNISLPLHVQFEFFLVRYNFRNNAYFGIWFDGLEGSASLHCPYTRLWSISSCSCENYWTLWK